MPAAVTDLRRVAVTGARNEKAMSEAPIESQATDTVEADNAEPVADSVNPQPVADSGPDDPEAAEDSANGEAAKYRRRLRSVEAERDTLAQQVQALQRQQVEQLCQAARIRPQAVWGSGAELSAMLNDDSSVNPEAVAEAINTAREQFGIHPQVGTHVPGVGNRPGQLAKTDQWVDAFKPQRAR